MSPEQVIILVAIILFSFFGYWFFTKRFGAHFLWIKHNILFLAFGIVGAVLFSPFSYPYNLESFQRNLPVFAIIPLCSFNSYYLIHDVTRHAQVKIVIKELLELLAIMFGSFVGIVLLSIFHFGSFSSGDMAGIFLVVFLIAIARILFNYSALERVLTKKQSELESVKINELQATTRLEILNARINPHFLYNALNSIAGLATVDGQKTQQMTIALSRLLRHALNSSEKNITTVEDEAETIRDYLEIEKIRFEDSLDYSIHISDEAKGYLIPRFLLQPLVENSVKHAFRSQGNNNRITIDVRFEREQLIINVHDNGQPFPENIRTGYGLQNVIDRLELLLQGKYELQITNKPLKQVIIKMKELSKEHVSRQ